MLTDRTNTIRASVKDVQFSLILTIGLVVMVIFLFLRSFAATVIPSVAVPLSIVGTFGVMYLLGYSLNNLSLMALTISTGFVVDDAIVMIENISRYLEEGDYAAGGGAEGLGADRVHDCFVDGESDCRADSAAVHGRYCGAAVPRVCCDAGGDDSGFGICVADADADDVGEAAEAYAGERADAFYRKSEEFFEYVIAKYAVGVRWVLRHQTLTLLVTLGTFLLTVYLFWIVPKGFFPVQDTGVLLGITEAPQTVSFKAMSSRQQALARIILQDKDVESVSSFIGIDGTNSTLNSGRIQINLKDREQRKSSALEVIQRLEPQVAKVDGIQCFLQPLQDLTVEDRVSRTQYQYSLEDANVEELALWTNKLVAKLKTIPILSDVASDQQLGGLEANLVIDRDTASRLGITPQNIDDTLDDAFAQRQVSTIFTQQNQYHVVLEVAPKFQRNSGIAGQHLCEELERDAGAAVGVYAL